MLHEAEKRLERIERAANEVRVMFPALSKNYVPGEGPFSGAEAFIIGEAPGAQEDIRRRPFIGASGIVLRQLMDLAGLWPTYSDCDRSKPANAWLTNVVKFRPPGNRAPLAVETDTFRELLVAEWQAVGAPTLIIPVGSVALSALFGKRMSILQAHGQHRRMRSAYTGQILNIWPMLHPAFALRAGPDIQELAESDWVRLGEWRKLNASD
jgi:uracil-DNA glycosylase family 4